MAYLDERGVATLWAEIRAYVAQYVSAALDGYEGGGSSSGGATYADGIMTTGTYDDGTLVTTMSYGTDGTIS